MVFERDGRFEIRTANNGFDAGMGVKEFRPDLVILDGNPLDDFRLIGSQVAALFMDGALVINNCGLQVESNGKRID